MLSPESFAHTRRRHVTDVVRVALERRGILGFIEIHDAMTLLEARALIWENVEHAPCDFQFVLDDGVPVSARQEHTQKILHFYPCVKIRACAAKASSRAESEAAAVASPHGRRRSSSGHTAATGDADAASLASTTSSEKISVWTASGDEFAVWVSEEYTFQQLRRDAARYWNLPPKQVALVDGDGCLWPEQAKILSVMAVDELLSRRIVLESKASSGGGGGSSSLRAKSSSRPWPSPSPFSETMRTSRRASHDASAAAASPPRAFSTWNDILTAPSSSTAAAAANPVEELWRVFTFYCVHGDSLELECIKAHQFNRLLRDARVLGAAVTPAIADIIYTSETKGKPQASGKMNFDEFLNALVKVARARHRRVLLHDAQQEDTLFQALVMDHILPLASRWPTHVWQQQTQLLRAPEIVAFASKFLDALLDIYAFYAKSHVLLLPAGAKAFYMAYADYQRFVNDFSVANLQISSVEAAQAFLAACSSPPFHEAMATATTTTTTPPQDAAVASLASPSSLDPNGDVLSCSSSNAPAACVAAAFQRLVETAEGVVVSTFPAAQVGRMCLSFSAFLDVLGRLGLASFARASHVRPLQSVKAVFHHLSRGLTRSRVLDIVHNHGSSSMHSGRFYSGSVAFNNKFLDMWRYEGSPDYLTGDSAAVASPRSGAAPAAAGGGGGGGGGGAGAVDAATPLSPLRRLTSSAALFDERVVPNGAGRGREALDRLVRNAFVRNAVAATATQRKCDALASASLTAPTTGASNDRDAAASADASVADESDTRERAVVGAGHATPPEASTREPPRTGGEPPTENAVASRSQHDPAVAAGAARDARPPLATDSLSPTAKPHSHHRSFVATGGGGGGVLHPDDEKALYESILLKGGVFKKYGQWGHPHRRFVWCSKAFDGVYWRPINKKHSLSKEGIPVVSIMAVLPGNSTRTRYAFMKHLSEEKSLSRCFSLVAEDRRLDLEADSEATRDLWMQALQFLMREHRPRMGSCPETRSFE